jgi:sugar phosphate isomerase/epimerase
MLDILNKIQINIPFTMLCESYLDVFISNNINPEIGFDAESLDSYAYPDFTEIAQRIDSAGLNVTFHAPFMDLSAGSPDSEIREITLYRFHQVLSLIPLFQPKSVVFHTGYDKRRYWSIWDEWVENSMSTWTMVGEMLKQAHVKFMIENVYEDEPRAILVLLKKLKPLDIGFCLDTGHQSVFSEHSLTAWLDALGPFVGQLHLHDNSGENDDHLALGSGNIDFKFLFEYLVKSEITPSIVTLEPHREEDLGPSLEYLQKIWPW